MRSITAANTVHRLPATVQAARPWYRHLWPWLLIAPPLAAVLGGAATLWLAIASDDGLVAKDYYKQGLAVSKQSTPAADAADVSPYPRPSPSRGEARIEMQAR